MYDTDNRVSVERWPLTVLLWNCYFCCMCFSGNMCGRRAEKEWLLREKIRLHAERVRDHRAQMAENPAEDMRSAQQELEIVSL